MVVKVVILLFTALVHFQCYGNFTIPEVTLEAYDPKGFKASIPVTKGIQMFAFHANINKEISQTDPGDYSQNFTSPSNNMWSYYNTDLGLKVGDEVNFWIFIQHTNIGYWKDNQKWKVTELICGKTITTVSGITHLCKNNVIFEEHFTQGIDSKKWIIEQYIPIKGPDYEFVSYQNKPDVCYIKNDKLYLKPKVDDDDAIELELNLRNGCTRSSKDECFFKREFFFIVPPVVSGRIVSRFKFRYGRIEIKTKLPAGDWIYPQMYLEQVSEPQKKLWIGYARGNDKLLTNRQEDVGGRLLYGGLVTNPLEPDRYYHLKTKRNSKPYSSEMHTYTVIWDKDRISLQVDGVEYGEINRYLMEKIHFVEDDMVQIVLGVGVGGINDFPDESRSGNNVKPWRNKNIKQIKTFSNAKNDWLRSWKIETDDRALQVDSVKVWAL